MSRVRRILHPTDFSPASNAAFARAVEMARTNKAELLLAHILTSVVPLPADGYVWPQLYADIEASAKAEGQKRLGMLIAKARKAGVRVKALLLDGVAHEQITRAARTKRADLLVLGTHGRTGLDRLLTGSVAERIVRHAPCSVFTVKPKRTA